MARIFALHAEPRGYPTFSLDFGAAGVTTVVCLALLWSVGRSRANVASCIVGAGLGLLFFDYTLGFALVDPRNIDWLLQRDWAQHFLGWYFYRNAPWAWPPGKFDTFWYPVGTAIIYTDSLPLFAIPLKIVSPWLPARFQYIGFWLCCSCVLQGTFGMLLVRRFFSSLAIQSLGASLLLLAPVFISRIDHDTLTAQWILLAALGLYFGRDLRSLKISSTWIVLAVIAGLVHPYLSMMLLALAGAYYLSCLVVAELSLRRVLLHGSAMVGATLLCWWLSGAFTLRPSGGGIALGIYNSNLLTWVDSQWMSRWLPGLPNAGDGQYDGRGYLGLGVIGLVCACALLALRRHAGMRGPRPIWPLLLITAGATVYAFSTRFTLGSTVLFDLTPAHASILAAFRGSGRFIWFSAYLITLMSFVFVLRNGGGRGAALVAGAVVLQLADLSPLHDRSQHMRQASAEPAVLLRDAGWTKMANGRRHITLVLPPTCGKEAAPYLPFSLLAADHGMTINTGYLARFDEQRTFAYCDVLRGGLASGKRDAESLYIVGAEQRESFIATSGSNMKCSELDGYTACALDLATPVRAQSVVPLQR